MNLKNTGIALGLGATILSGCDSNSNNYGPLSHLNTIPPKKYTVAHVDTLTKQKLVDTMIKPLNAIITPTLTPVKKQTISQDELYTIPMKRVNKGPLRKMKGMTHDLRILLGGVYADSFMRADYNKELYDALLAQNHKLEGNSTQWVGMADVHTDIKVPLVYPTLKNFFSESLKDFLANRPELEEQVGDDREVIIITRDYEMRPNKNHTLDSVRRDVIGYYIDGQLVMAQHMSAGVGKDFMEYDHRLKRKRHVHAYSKEGVFYTNYFSEQGDKRDSTYSSGTFGAGKKGHGRAPMPYAVPINDSKHRDDGVYLHTGFADGLPRSHECNRLPGWLAMYFYDILGDRKVKTIVRDLYDAQTSKPKKIEARMKEEKKKTEKQETQNKSNKKASLEKLNTANKQISTKPQKPIQLQKWQTNKR